MKITFIIASAALAAVLSSSGALAWDQDPFAMYIQRSDTVTLGAGNARDVNAVTHVIDPWPRNVGNRRIPMNGARAVKAFECYAGVPAGGAAGNQNSGGGNQININVGGGRGGGGGSGSGCPRPPISPTYSSTIGAQ